MFLKLIKKKELFNIKNLIAITILIKYLTRKINQCSVTTNINYFLN